jgi:hypothetical protein
MTSLTILGVVALFCLHTTPASGDCAPDDKVAGFVGSSDPADDSIVFCDYHLCKKYWNGSSHIPSSYYEAVLTDNSSCWRSGGSCHPAFLRLSVLVFDESRKGKEMNPWGWKEEEITVSYICKSTKAYQRNHRDTTTKRFVAEMRPLMRRNATCWREKVHQLLSSGEADCKLNGQGPERCCASKHSG